MFKDFNGPKYAGGGQREKTKDLTSTYGNRVILGAEEKSPCKKEWEGLGVKAQRTMRCNGKAKPEKGKLRVGEFFRIGRSSKELTWVRREAWKRKR